MFVLIIFDIPKSPSFTVPRILRNTFAVFKSLNSANNTILKIESSILIYYILLLPVQNILCMHIGNCTGDLLKYFQNISFGHIVMWLLLR